MKNFKKLFASLAIVAMLASSVPTTVLGAASYSDELQGAYDYAYDMGVTTQSTIDSANMFGGLIRSHMAKMMVNYAKEVKGLTANASLECNFTDVANQSDELKGFIKEACQMGLMGQGITAFNPNGIVTRAQFGTVLSRVLYGAANDGGNPYYVDHLNALKTAGIMTKIDNPNMTEVRGYVMLMMQRAAGNVTPAICQTPENILSCSLNLDTCPTECKTNEVKAGDLTLSSVGVDYTNIPKAGLVSFGSIKLTAGGSDVTLNTIKLKKLGLSDLSTATKVFFEKDGTRVSSKVSFDATTKIASVIFTTPLVVKTSETLDVIMLLSGVNANEDIQIESTDVISSAANVNGSFSSAVLRTSNYDVVGIKTVGVDNATDSAKVDATKLVNLGELTIQKTGTGSSTRAVNVTALTLTTTGLNLANLSYLNDVAIYRDDVKVSTKTIVGSRSLSFVLNDEIKTTYASPVSYVVKGKIANADKINETYSFYLKNVEDLTVLEKDTQFRATNNVTNNFMGITKIVGADLRFNENTVSALTVVPGTKNVVFYSGSLQSVGLITLEKLQNVMATIGNGSGLDQVLDNLYLKVGSYVIAVDNLASSGNLVFDGQATVNGTVPFMIYGDVRTDAPSTYVSFTSSVGGTSTFLNKDDVNGDPVSSIGSIGGRKVTINTADLTFSNTSASTKSVQRGDRNITVANLQFATTSDVVSKIYSFKANIVTALSTGWNLFDGTQVTVYNDAGTAIASSVIRAGTTLYSLSLNDALTVSKGHPVNLTVKIDQVPNAVTGGQYLKLLFNNVVAKDIINSDYVGVGISANSTLLNAVIGGTPSIFNQSYTAKLVKYGTETTIGNVKFKATSADVVLNDLYFQLDGIASMTNISAKLYEDGTYVADLGKLSGSVDVLYATNLNKTVALGTGKTYEVKATFNTINTNADVLPEFTTKLATGSFSSTYGTVIVPALNGTISSTIKVVNQIPTITAVNGYTKGNDVVYKLTLNSSAEVDLSGLTLSVNGTNVTGGLNGTTAYLAPSDINYLVTNYTTIAVGSNKAVFAGLAQGDLSIAGTKDIYVILPGAALLANTNGNTSTIRVAATNMDYMDIFADDNSMKLNENMLYNYATDIAGTLDLLKVVNIQ